MPSLPPITAIFGFLKNLFHSPLHEEGGLGLDYVPTIFSRLWVGFLDLVITMKCEILLFLMYRSIFNPWNIISLGLALPKIQSSKNSVFLVFSTDLNVALNTYGTFEYVLIMCPNQFWYYVELYVEGHFKNLAWGSCLWFVSRSPKSRRFLEKLLWS